jgi:hypothetical protein
MKKRIYERLWILWHMRFRTFFDDVNPKPGWREQGGHWGWFSNRPWWHMCCNGDAGGWRTKLCSHLEHRWRD